MKTYKKIAGISSNVAIDAKRHYQQNKPEPTLNFSYLFLKNNRLLTCYFQPLLSHSTSEVDEPDKEKTAKNRIRLAASLELKIRWTDVIVSLERRARELRLNERTREMRESRLPRERAKITTGTRKKKGSIEIKENDWVAAVSPRGSSSNILDRTEIWKTAKQTAHAA